MDPAATAELQKREIVAATTALFEAMRGRDAEALRSLIDARAQVFSMRGGRLSARSAEEFIEACVETTEPVDERMIDPEVRIDGEIATLWCRYDLHRGQSYSHSGFDSFQFVRDGGRWRLVSLMYTVRTPT